MITTIDLVEYGKELRYMENGRDEDRERDLIERFPPGHDTPYLNVPAVIMDCKERVIAWYIPDALTPEIQVRSK